MRFLLFFILASSLSFAAEQGEYKSPESEGFIDSIFHWIKDHNEDREKGSRTQDIYNECYKHSVKLHEDYESGKDTSEELHYFAKNEELFKGYKKQAKECAETSKNFLECDSAKRIVEGCISKAELYITIFQSRKNKAISNTQNKSSGTEESNPYRSRDNARSRARGE